MVEDNGYVSMYTLIQVGFNNDYEINVEDIRANDHDWYMIP
jgi:hypothetical protein